MKLEKGFVGELLGAGSDRSEKWTRISKSQKIRS